MTRCAGALLVGTLAAVVAVVAPVRSATSHAVTLHAADGAAVAGTLWEPSQRPAAAVLLLPMQTRTRDDWQPVAAKLADAGMIAFAIDVRGFGAPGGGPLEVRVDASAVLADISAAVDALSARPDLRPGGIGVAGASLGANAAVLAAAADPRVRSLALLSPGLDYRGLRIEGAMKKCADRPALLLASVKDPYVLRSIRELTRDASGGREQRLVEATGHGLTLVSREPDLAAVLADWFKRTLP